MRNISHNSYWILKMLWNLSTERTFWDEIEKENQTRTASLFPKGNSIRDHLVSACCKQNCHIILFDVYTSTCSSQLPKDSMSDFFLRSHFVGFSPTLLLRQNNVHSKTMIVLFFILIFSCLKIA